VPTLHLLFSPGGTGFPACGPNSMGGDARPTWPLPPAYSRGSIHMHQIQPERGVAQKPQTIIRWGIILLFLVIPVILFWRRDLFFILDDWSFLHLMVGNNLFVYVRMADGEVLMPVTRTIYYILIHIFGVHYEWLILINCLLTGLNGFLLYLIFKSHFKPNLALALSILYITAAVNSATAQMSFYICAILCLGFFLLSLFFTQIYVRRPSTMSLLLIGLCAWFSVNSWNFSLLGIWTLPVYAAWFGRTGAQRQLGRLVGVIGLVFLIFTAEYFTLNGLAGATSHNPQLFSQFLSWSYVSHWAVGSLLAPFDFLFGVEFRWQTKIVIGLAIFMSTVALIMRAGNLAEKKLCFWAILLNALPFSLVSLARHHFLVGQAFTDRYAIFTIIGALFLLGATWQIIAAKLPARRSTRVILPLAILAAMIGTQVHTLPISTRLYVELSQEAKLRYSNLRDRDVRAQLSGAAEKDRIFFNQNQPFPVHPSLNNGQAVAIYQFLAGLQ
jgi:hypothetical protein